MRLFPIIIIIVLIFLGGVYWAATFSTIEANTTIAEDSQYYTGYSLLNLIGGFASQQWVILAFLAFLILFVGTLGVLMRSGD